MTLQFDESGPFDTFQFALKAEESKRQYPRRLKMFLDFGIDPKIQLREQYRGLL